MLIYSVYLYDNAYFYGENVCVRVEMMQNSSVGRTAGYNSLPCIVPGSSPGVGSFYTAVIAQLVEHWLPKPRVASSSLVYRSNSCFFEPYVQKFLPLYIYASSG